MVKQYKLEVTENFHENGLYLEGKHICLKMNIDNAAPIKTSFLYREYEKQKIGGKNMRNNQNLIPGIYKDFEGNSYYIKIPRDATELFCEMLHGTMTNILRFNNYLQELNHHISAAEGILIHHKHNCVLVLCIPILLDFVELFRYLGTGKSNNKERQNWLEIINRNVYSKFVETDLGVEDSFSIKIALAECIVQSVTFFGDYSHHSNNIGLYSNHKKIAKIDGGASFRHFAKNSPTHILFPNEYVGLGAYKLICKNYIDYYTRITDLKEILIITANNQIRRINDLNKNNKPICDIVYETIIQVKNTYALALKANPFLNKKNSLYFAMNLAINEKLLAKQFETIMYRNVEGFQEIKLNNANSYNSINYNKAYLTNRDTIYSNQLSILHIILCRGKDAKFKSKGSSKKENIKNFIIDSFKNSINNNGLKDIDFFLCLYLLCSPTGSVLSYSTTSSILTSRLNLLSSKDPIKKYLGIPLDKQKISISVLNKCIKNRYETELMQLKKYSYIEYLSRVNGNSYMW